MTATFISDLVQNEIFEINTTTTCCLSLQEWAKCDKNYRKINKLKIYMNWRTRFTIIQSYMAWYWSRHKQILLMLEKYKYLLKIWWPYIYSKNCRYITKLRNNTTRYKISHFLEFKVMSVSDFITRRVETLFKY